MKRKILALVACLLLALVPSTAVARGGGSSGGGGGSKGGGFSSSKSSSGSKPSSSSKSSSSSKPALATSSKPSTGSVPQKPVTKILPPAPPRPVVTSGGRAVPKVQTPAGRDYTRDRSFIVSHPSYANPYFGSYYGAFDSPFFYLWLFSAMDGDRSNDPAPPSSDDRIGEGMLSYLGIMKAEAQMLETS